VLNPVLVPAGARRFIRAVALLCVLAVPAAAAGPAWAQTQELAGGAAEAYFGASVSVSGDTVVIGAFGQSQGRGAAYVYVQSGGAWTLQQQLTASDAAMDDSFGQSVSVSGDTAVIGAWGKNAGAGAAYVFVRSGGTWSQLQELTASDGAAGGEFGQSVSLSGDTVVIGAPGNNAAYVLVQSGGAWTQQQELFPARGTGGKFGSSVSVSGDAALVGAPGTNDNLGATYVFVRSGGAWSQQQELFASDAAMGDDFGQSVSLSGGAALIGAPYAGLAQQGAAYVFVQGPTAWSEQQELTASGSAQFGGSVSLSGGTALVAEGLGTAYVFVQNGGTWSQQQLMAASNEFCWPSCYGGPGPGQVSSVSVSGGTALMGTASESFSEPGGWVMDAGAAYVFGTTQIAITGVSVSGGGANIAQNAWVEIYGSNLAPASVGAGLTWAGAPSFASGQMPTELQDVSVTVNGKPAYICFISATQVNVLTPLDPTIGPVAVEVNNGTATSAAFTANLQTVAPGFVRFGDGTHIAAEHADFSLLGPAPMSVPGYTFTPATPGETILLYGDGFGLPVSTLTVGSAVQTGALPTLPQVTIGGTTATVRYAGVISPGLYQINVVVPSTSANGDNAVVAIYTGASTPSGAMIPVSR
jgi:uncharacterized protein (TIGR03437 family)